MTTVGRLVDTLELDDVWVNRFSGSDIPPESEITQTDRTADKLFAEAQKSGQSDRLRDEGITERAIIRLAQRIAGDTDDLGQAWTELTNAMDIAVRVQQEGRIASNHGDFIDEVLARVAALAADGEYQTASAEIATALAEEDAAHTARKTRLLDSGIEMAMLGGNSTSAATLLVQKADLDAGGQAGFEELRSLFIAKWEQGRDKGIALDLTISIDLATIVQTRATSPDERGTALNDLGTALRTLGARESGTARLEQAVTAYENALLEMTREQVPLDWARAQMNLGIALRTLGARESGTGRLQQAVTACENALLEWTREQVPLDWARAQMNLGNALQTLGARESGTARLEQAVTAYENALLERTRDRVPLEWAQAQMNLGTALATLGARESGTARLEQAVTAYENALLERTRDGVPLDWAMVQANLSILQIEFFDKTTDPSRLTKARSHALAAQEVYEDAGAEYYIDWIKQLFAKIDAAEAG